MHQEASAHPQTALYLLRPPIVLSPDALGAKASVPAMLAPLARAAASALWHLPGLPALVPNLPLQVVHQDDVAEALRLCVVGAGAPEAYNIAAADVITLVDIVRELGLRPMRPRAGRSLRWLEASRSCRTCPREPSGSRPSATRPSWTRPRHAPSSGGGHGTPRSSQSARRSADACFE